MVSRYALSSPISCFFSKLEGFLIIIFYIFKILILISVLQPDNPTDLSGKIYEMMGTALSAQWSAPAAEAVEMHHQQEEIVNSSGKQSLGALEAEVIEPSASESQK